MTDYNAFQKIVWDYYDAHGRHDLPWRFPNTNGSFDPYKIMVSEIMLQQTQVPRVILKFQQFMSRFPDVQVLAGAPLGEVLSCWSGLGYNRRAKFLWQVANTIVRDHAGQVPATREQLVALPGIGVNTAGAIIVYAFNRPEVFIETNISTVIIHHFFADKQGVSDSAVAELIAATLPDKNIRQWYWALMDYGTHLKRTVGNLSQQSRSFTQQSRFEGSRRQIRGKVLKLLARTDSRSAAELQVEINDGRLSSVLTELIAEGLVVFEEHTYKLPRI